jgi:hypothetical protein
MSKPRKPTIDDRIQALTQSLELLVSLHTDLEKTTAERFGTVAAIFRDAHGSIQSLERIATAHQQRLDDHGQRIQRLEDK